MPRLAHTPARAIPVERTGVAPEFVERGFLKARLLEAANNHSFSFWLCGRALDSGHAERQRFEPRLPSSCAYSFLLCSFFAYTKTRTLRRRWPHGVIFFVAFVYFGISMTSFFPFFSIDVFFFCCFFATFYSPPPVIFFCVSVRLFYFYGSQWVDLRLLSNLFLAFFSWSLA